jgi:hypothetical protein
MLYHTIVHQLLELYPELHEQLRKQRQLLQTIENYARDLKTRHEELKEQLAMAKPASSYMQIANEALEIALQELEDSLPPAFPPDDSQAFSLEDAMTFIRKHTPPA